MIADFSNVKDAPQQVFEFLTKVMIGQSFAVGIPEITEKNVDEFYKRCCQIAVVKGEGPMLTGTKKGHMNVETWVRRHQIKRFIGMKTDAPKLNRVQFERKLIDILNAVATDALSKSGELQTITVWINVRRTINENQMFRREKDFWGRSRFRNKRVAVKIETESRVETDWAVEGLKAFRKLHHYLRAELFVLTVTETQRTDNEYQ